MSFDLEELATRWKELVTKSLSDLEKWELAKVGLKEGKKFYIPTDHIVFLKKNVKVRMEAILKDLQKDK